MLSGSPLPEGFLGKSWACSQLSKQARGELLLFTDADTTFMPDALKSLVATLDGEGADLLTGLPRQEVHTWGERLLVPFFSWVLLSFTRWRWFTGLKTSLSHRGWSDVIVSAQGLSSGRRA